MFGKKPQEGGTHGTIIEKEWCRLDGIRNQYIPMTDEAISAFYELFSDMITGFNADGQPTEWTAKDFPTIMGWYGVRVAFLMLYARNWVANPNPDSDGYGDYYMDVTDDIFDMAPDTPEYWYICAPRSGSVVDYYNYKVAIDPDTIEEVGKRRFYCSAVNGKAPEVYIEVCVIGFPTSYTMPT